MKITINEEPKEFKPVTVSIILESQKEVNNLHAIVSNLTGSYLDFKDVDVKLATDFVFKMYKTLDEKVVKL